MAANKPVTDNDEVFEEGDAPKEAQTVHRIRANSTIMQLNKILGKWTSRAWILLPLGEGPGGTSRMRSEATFNPYPYADFFYQPSGVKSVANKRVAHDSCQQR